MTKQYVTILLSGLFSQVAIAQSTQTFEAYSQQIPGTDVSFRMVPIKGGSFKLGSPDGEKGRNKDEGPARKIELSDFWMGATEVTFDEYDVFADAEKDKTPVPDGTTRPSPPTLTLPWEWARPAVFRLTV